MAKYRLSNNALEDLLRIHQYGIEQFGEVQATRYIDAFFEHFEIIASNPYSFEAVDYVRVGYRRCVCGVDSVFYRIQDKSIEIMAIIGKQDIDQIL